MPKSTLTASTTTELMSQWRKDFAFTRNGWPSGAHPAVVTPSRGTPVQIAQAMVSHYVFSEYRTRPSSSPSTWKEQLMADSRLRAALAHGRSERATRRPASIVRTLEGLASGAVQRLDVRDRRRIEEVIGLKPGQMGRAAVLGAPLRLLAALHDESVSHSREVVEPVRSDDDIRRYQSGYPLLEPVSGRIDEPFLVLAAWSLLRFRKRSARQGDLRRVGFELFKLASKGHAAYSRPDDRPLAHWFVDGLLFAGDEFDWDLFKDSAVVGRQWAMSVAGSVLHGLSPRQEAEVVYGDVRQIAERMRQMMIALPVFRPPRAVVPELCKYVFGVESDAMCEKLEHIRVWSSRCESDACFGAALWSLIARDLAEDVVPAALRGVLGVGRSR